MRIHRWTGATIVVGAWLAVSSCTGEAPARTISPHATARVVRAPNDASSATARINDAGSPRPQRCFADGPADGTYAPPTDCTLAECADGRLQIVLVDGCITLSDAPKEMQAVWVHRSGDGAIVVQWVRFVGGIDRGDMVTLRPRGDDIMARVSTFPAFEAASPPHPVVLSRRDDLMAPNAR